jgi:hypothetical protein
MDAHALLACWEQGRGRHPLDRGLLLYAAAEPDADPDMLADRPLGQRNAALLHLRRLLFGDELNSCVDCPQCGERLEFDISAQTLLEKKLRDDQTHVDVYGTRLRLPTTRDLASIADEGDADVAARKLLERLIVRRSDELASTPEEVMRALDVADPHLDISLALTCPACTHRWGASFDVPTFVWEEIEVRARRLLDEVHTLARTYGWSERKILELSDIRRNAYLERVFS